MSKTYYKNDFPAYLDLYAINGYNDRGEPILTPLGFPEWDWTAKFVTTRPSAPFVVSSIGGTLTNCINEDGRILVLFKNHNLLPGKISVEFQALISDEVMPDGTALHVIPSPLDIELTRHAAPCPSALEAKLILPYIKGKDAYEYAVEHGYAGTADEFGEALSEVPNKQNKLTASDDFSLTDQGGLSLTERAKRAVFDDLWLSAWEQSCDPTNGGIDAEATDGKPYLANGLRLTYKEAVDVLVAYSPIFAYDAYSFRTKIRTNIPPKQSWVGKSASFCFANCIKMDVANVGLGCLVPGTYDFNDCTSLRIIIGRFTISGAVTKIFSNCKCLEEVRIVAKTSFSLESCPLLSLESLQYLVANAANGKEIITVTVHPEVYAKLTDSANAEWHQVLLDAIAKNISFATL